jgi:hypothetical protein
VKNIVAKAPCLTFAVKRALTSVFSTEELTQCSVMGHRNIKAIDKKGLDVCKRSEIERKLLGLILFSAETSWPLFILC